VIEGQDVVLSTAELAGISRRELGEPVESLDEHRDTVIAALDLVFTGI
jgi:toxin CcdB